MPFRVVIDTAGFAWIDNLHSSIRDIIVYGEDTRLKDVSCYIIDLTDEIPVVVDVDHYLHNSVDDIKGAICAAYKRNSRINDIIRNLDYTIGEFLSDNHINAETVGLAKDIVKKYKDIRADKMYQEYYRKR